MVVKEFTNKKAVQLLATQSRRTDIEPLELCNLHFEMGKLLAYEMLEDFELRETEIKHVQGTKKGMELSDPRDIFIVGLLRAGLFAAQGVRSVFSGSQFILFSENGKINCSGKTVIIVDAVVNTGKSIEKAIRYFQDQKAAKIIVATLIMQKESTKLSTKYKKVSFYALRVSENKYTGKGSTDTGNRLFNTY